LEFRLKGWTNFAPSVVVEKARKGGALERGCGRRDELNSYYEGGVQFCHCERGGNEGETGHVLQTSTSKGKTLRESWPRAREDESGHKKTHPDHTGKTNWQKGKRGTSGLRKTALEKGCIKGRRAKKRLGGSVRGKRSLGYDMWKDVLGHENRAVGESERTQETAEREGALKKGGRGQKKP